MQIPNPLETTSLRRQEKHNFFVSVGGWWYSTPDLVQRAAVHLFTVLAHLPGKTPKTTPCMYLMPPRKAVRTRVDQAPAAAVSTLVIQSA